MRADSPLLQTLWSLALVSILAGAERAPAAPEGPARPRFHSREFAGAKSCARCHPRQYLEWRGSTHAYALLDPLFRAENLHAQKDTKGEIGMHCLQCHSPIGVRSGELPASVRAEDLERLPEPITEGVSCETCHLATAPAAGSPISDASFGLSPGGAFTGRLHRPADADAHESRYSAFLGKSRFCGTCHDVTHRGRVIEKTFSEWQLSPNPVRAIECQDCHMLRYSGRAAEGGLFRESLRRHNFPGVAMALVPFPNRGYQEEQIRRFLRTAARLSVRVPATAAAGERLALPVTVRNSGTGHNLPSGSMRQLWLEVTVVDGAGRVIFGSGHLDEKGYLPPWTPDGRTPEDPQLVTFVDAHLDAEGKRVPYWKGVRVLERSLRSLEERTAIYRVPIPETALGDSLRARVRLLLRPFPRRALAALGLEPLAARLPVWEVQRYESPPIEVARRVPRRTRYEIPGDFPGPLEALAALRSGDEVTIAPGEYRLAAPLDFRAKAIRLVGRDGPERTILRLEPSLAGRGDASVAIFRSGEGPGSRLEGVTLAGGHGTLLGGIRRGGGVYIHRASPSIADTIVTDCAAAGGIGGGICCEEGAPRLRAVRVLHCRARLGGGLALRTERGKSLVLEGLEVQGCRAEKGGGVYAESGTRLELRRILLAGNFASDSGGGLHGADGSRLLVDHATIVHNRARRGPAALRGDAARPPRVRHSIFWANRPPRFRAEVSVSLLDHDRPDSPGCRNAFPLFVDPGGEWVVPAGGGEPRWVGGNYRLLPGSPAVDAEGAGDAPDPDDTYGDLGAYFLEQPLRGFLRGDVDGSGRVGWSDLVLLADVVAGRREIACADSADVDDGGTVDAIDVARLAAHLFGAGPAPAAPYPNCGLDPTFADGLACQGEPPPCRIPARRPAVAPPPPRY